MENASKALIIAASILLAILIVSMGVAIFNKAHSSYDTSNLDATEINMFNQKFERYADTQLGSQVKSLISFAISNASTNKDDPIKLPTIVCANFPTAEQPSGEGIVAIAGIPGVNGQATASSNMTNYTKGLGNIRTAIKSTHTYKIKLNYSNTGLIDKITIDYNT